MQAEIDSAPQDRPTRERPAGDVPRTIRLSERDNVAIVVNAFGLPAGTVFPDGLRLTEFVPQGHKVALADIPEGGAVRRYGEVVGIATQDIPRGAWVEESRVATPVAPALDALELATRVPVGGHQEHPGDLDQRAMRRRHPRRGDPADQAGASAALPQRR
jgi:galactarate dehydratase